MSGTTVENGFDTIVSKVDPKVGDLAVKVRELIREVYPKVTEVPWLNQNVIGYGVGPKKMSQHFCYIALHHDHINLSFNYGAELPDPHDLLEGPGRLLRHTKIENLDDLKNPHLKTLLEAASKHLPKLKNDDALTETSARAVDDIERVIDTLARHHAYWWNHPSFATEMFPVGYWTRSAKRFSQYLQRRQTAWEDLLRNEADWFPTDFRSYTRRFLLTCTNTGKPISSRVF